MPTLKVDRISDAELLMLIIVLRRVRKLDPLVAAVLEKISGDGKVMWVETVGDG